MNGAEVCTIEDLKKNFNPADLVSYRNRFAAWLKGWDYDEEAMEVVSLDPELTDEDWLEAICKIIGISEDELKVSWSKIGEQAKQEEERAAAQLEEMEEKKRARSVERLRISDFSEQDAPWRNDESIDGIEGIEYSICGNKIFVAISTSDFKNLMFVSEDRNTFKCIDVTANDYGGDFVYICPIASSAEELNYLTKIETNE